MVKTKNFENLNLQGYDFTNMDLSNANFKNANLSGADFRGSDMTNANIQGANLFGAVMQNVIGIHTIKYDDKTKYFKMVCPEEGAFLGYKLCCDYRVVRLLIPADAKRSSSTLNTCRCNKAKVIKIESFDQKQEFQVASSLVNDEFEYRLGEYVQVENFNEDRWTDSTTGIHFFMTREEAKHYFK